MKETWITLGGHQAVRLDLENVGAMRAIGLGRLRFSLRITSTHEVADNSPLWVSGDLSITNFGANGGYVAPLVSGERPSFLPLGRGSRPLTLTADITNAQLQAVEDNRTAAIQFALDLSGHVLLDGTPQPFFNSRIDYLVNQTDWISLLEQMNYRRLVLIEVGAPNLPATSGAVRYFQDAQKNYSEHAWRNTVESLRQCLAAIVGEDAEVEELTNDVEGELKDLRKKSQKEQVGYNERYELVRRAAKFLCDLGAHPEVAETTKQDAYGALLIVAGLLQGTPSRGH